MSSRSPATPIVQWNEPISPAENAAILARLATYPGVNVYWMGRSYLGENIWAADITLPTPALLRSWPKETTLKASIVYSGPAARQRSLQHQPHRQAGRAAGHRSR